MKYLLTFAVVSGALRDRLERCLLDAPPAQPEQLVVNEALGVVPVRFVHRSQVVADIEESLFNALREDIDSVAFFRSVMDGWDATHRLLNDWFAKDRPAGREAWQGYVDKGVFSLSAQDAHLFLPAPDQREVEAFCQQHALNAYAIRAVFDAFYESIAFVSSTKAVLIATASCLGPTLSDDEYV